MFKYLVALPLAAMAAPAMACYNSEAGDIYKYSNSRDINVTENGTAIPTSQYPNGWGVKRDKEIAGTSFNFAVNMDRDQQEINGILFSFHTTKPIVDWKVGDTETFKPYKSLGASVDELSFTDFSCGFAKSRERKFQTGYFGSRIQMTTGGPLSGWHLDMNQSSATLTAVEDGYTSAKNEFSLSATMNLVYVKAASERWRDGGKIKQSGPKKEVSITMKRVRFLRPNRQRR